MNLDNNVIYANIIDMREIAIIISACAITVVLEWLFLFIVKVRDRRLWLSIPMNIVTNVSFNIFLNYGLKKMPVNDILFWVIIVLLECLIVLVEGGFYQLIKKDKYNLLFSLIANAITAIYGSLLINAIFYFI